MDGRIRHDIRHPVATISMIASTMAVFEGNVDPGTLATYRGQVTDELSSLRRLADMHGVTLDLDDLSKAVESFLEGHPRSHDELYEACQRVIVQMSLLQDEDAT